jgi:hypothetical protein
MQKVNKPYPVVMGDVFIFITSGGKEAIDWFGIKIATFSFSFRVGMMTVAFIRIVYIG